MASRDEVMMTVVDHMRLGNIAFPVEWCAVSKYISMESFPHCKCYFFTRITLSARPTLWFDVCWEPFVKYLLFFSIFAFRMQHFSYPYFPRTLVDRYSVERLLWICAVALFWALMNRLRAWVNKSFWKALAQFSILFANYLANALKSRAPTGCVKEANGQS